MAEPNASARAYARIRYRLLLADLAASCLVLVLIQASGWSHAVARWWSGRVANEPGAILGYLASLGAAYYLALLPLHFYAGFVVEHRFSLSRMRLRDWVAREGKRLTLSAALSAVLIEGLYAILRHAPGSWPLWATAGWAGVSVVLARVFPTVVLPLFYQTTPLHDEPLVGRLLDLCRRTGLSALGVFRFGLGAETRKANAALAGLGKTRRVLLSDTLIERFPPDEIEGVLAHELAHHRYRHITKALCLSAVGSWLAFTLIDRAAPRWLDALGIKGLADIAGFPLLALALSALGLISLPLQNGLSRHFEWQADRFAAAMAARPLAFADALRRLADVNLADPDPPRWIVWFFYDHPPITQRIQAAERAATPP
jgi:STE24 endopeptidase